MPETVAWNDGKEENEISRFVLGSPNNLIFKPEKRGVFVSLGAGATVSRTGAGLRLSSKEPGGSKPPGLQRWGVPLLVPLGNRGTIIGQGDNVSIILCIGRGAQIRLRIR